MSTDNGTIDREPKCYGERWIDLKTTDSEISTKRR